jgi:excisionase family DNA binding protein
MPNGHPSETLTGRSRISVPEISQRLNIGRLAVYALLEQGILPGIRLGRRWIITRNAYEQWERTCGMRVAGLPTEPEVTVVN